MIIKYFPDKYIEALWKEIEGRSTVTLRNWWTDHSIRLLRLAVVLMSVAAVVWLGYQFWRLLGQASPVWQASPSGAIDLKFRYDEVQHWFAGRPVYGGLKSRAPYPPASYVMLWPLLGWLELTPARWLWAATTGAALAWLVYLIVRESGVETLVERTFVALMPLSMYATGAAIGNGQLIVHLLPALLAGLLLLSQRQCRWPGELLAAVLVLGALVKPSVSVPFFWIVLFVPGRLRPGLLIVSGYVALTLVAASFQAPGVLSLIHGWLVDASAVAIRGGHANLHIWLATVGLEAWLLPASLLILVALGCWTYRYRYADLWLLLGVTAIVARLWAKHWWFDDLLILLPMVTLCRIAKRGLAPHRCGVLAGTLLAITLAVMLAPGGLYLFPAPWNTLYVTGQITIWITALIFLLVQAWQEEKHQARTKPRREPPWPSHIF